MGCDIRHSERLGAHDEFPGRLFRGIFSRLQSVWMWTTAQGIIAIARIEMCWSWSKRQREARMGLPPSATTWFVVTFYMHIPRNNNNVPSLASAYSTARQLDNVLKQAASFTLSSKFSFTPPLKLFPLAVLSLNIRQCRAVQLDWFVPLAREDRLP